MHNIFTLITLVVAPVEEYGVLVPLDAWLEGAGLGGAVAAHLDDQALARKLLLGRSTLLQDCGNLG